MCRPVGRAVTRSSLERKVRGSNLESVKSDVLSPTARHRCNISSIGAVLPGRNDAEMGPQTRYTLQRWAPKLVTPFSVMHQV